MKQKKSLWKYISRYLELVIIQARYYISNLM